MTDVQMTGKPTLGSRMAHLRGFADTGYAFAQAQCMHHLPALLETLASYETSFDGWRNLLYTAANMCMIVLRCRFESR